MLKRAKTENHKSMPGGGNEDSPGVEASALQQQPPLEQLPGVQAGIRPIANFQVSPPDKFSFKPENWPKWIQRFERFRKATGLDK